MTMVIPRNITADFSGESGPGFVAQYPGKCMTEDLCEFGNISPGDWVKYNPGEGGGLVHTICLARDNGATLCSREPRQRRTGYSEVHANNKPTKFQGNSVEDMGY